MTLAEEMKMKNKEKFEKMFRDTITLALFDSGNIFANMLKQSDEFWIWTNQLLKEERDRAIKICSSHIIPGHSVVQPVINSIIKEIVGEE